MQFVIVQLPDRREVLLLASRDLRIAMKAIDSGWKPIDTPIDQALVTAACPAPPGETR